MIIEGQEISLPEGCEEIQLQFEMFCEKRKLPLTIKRMELFYQGAQAGAHIQHELIKDFFFKK